MTTHAVGASSAARQDVALEAIAAAAALAVLALSMRSATEEAPRSAASWDSLAALKATVEAAPQAVAVVLRMVILVMATVYTEGRWTGSPAGAAFTGSVVRVARAGTTAKITVGAAVAGAARGGKALLASAQALVAARSPVAPREHSRRGGCVAEILAAFWAWVAPILS